MSSHSHPSLKALARAFGGDCLAGGRQALIPAPGHSPHDRSVSLRLVDGRVVAHGFGACDWREVLDDLRARGWIDAENRLLEGGVPVPDRGGAPDRTHTERIAAARRLWDQAGPVSTDGPAAVYAAHRGLDLSEVRRDALREHAAVPASVYRERGPRGPALLAAVLDGAGALTAVEVTHLDALGRRSASARVSRKVIGVLPAGCAVRLSDAGPALVVGEGVFTTLSAIRRFAVPGWALLSTGNLRRWTPPEGVRHVVIAGDRGIDGERSARTLQSVLSQLGVFAELAFPPPGYGDWNDLDQEKAKEGWDGASGSDGNGP